MELNSLLEQFKGTWPIVPIVSVYVIVRGIGTAISWWVSLRKTMAETRKLKAEARDLEAKQSLAATTPEGAGHTTTVEKSLATLDESFIPHFVRTPWVAPAFLVGFFSDIAAIVCLGLTFPLNGISFTLMFVVVYLALINFFLFNSSENQKLEINRFLFIHSVLVKSLQINFSLANAILTDTKRLQESIAAIHKQGEVPTNSKSDRKN
jgi:hypothetical protein